MDSMGKNCSNLFFSYFFTITSPLKNTLKHGQPVQYEKIATLQKEKCPSYAKKSKGAKG